MAKRNDMAKRQRRSRGLKLLAAPLAAAMLCSVAFAEKNEKPDLSDWTPPKSKMTYSQPGGPGGAGGAAAPGGRVHKVGTCAKFKALFGPKSPLANGDQIHVGLKSNCPITDTIEIKKAVAISGAAPGDAALSRLYDQTKHVDFEKTTNHRESLYKVGFDCRAKDKPCFLIDVPDGRAARLTGLSFRSSDEMYAPLILARGGALVLQKNLIVGNDLVRWAQPVSLLVIQTASADIRYNTIIGGDNGIELYPYLAAPSSLFSSAFEIGQNVIGWQAEDGISIIGGFSKYQRLKSEVKVYVYGNRIGRASNGIATRDVRGVVYRNVFSENGSHIGLADSELLISQNIMRGSYGPAISVSRASESYIDSNLFEANMVDEEGEVSFSHIIEGGDGPFSLLGGGSPYPSNNLCRNQPLATFGFSGKKKRWFEFHAELETIGEDGEEPYWNENVKTNRKVRKLAKANLEALVSTWVRAHVLFGRPFNLHPSDGYTMCYDYSDTFYMYSTDTRVSKREAADTRVSKRRTADNFFDSDF